MCSIWTAKLGVCEFLARMVETFWRREYELTLRWIRYFLVATFIAIVIATLGECRPFSHYWQVVPDPGPQCRTGYAQLITMGVCDITTDILLVCFPIPMVLKSAIPFKRKFRLVLLFSMSIILICITGVRIPEVIKHHGRQQYRTVFASSEILGAASVSNAIVLGSFLRDRGVKKTKKYKLGSVSDSIDRASQRRPTITSQHMGSVEDLIREMGWRMPKDLEAQNHEPRPAPVAPPASPPSHVRKPSFVGNGKGWQFPKHDSIRDSEESDPQYDVLDDPAPSPKETQTASRQRLSFFDVGGLLDPSNSSTPSSIVPSPTSTTVAQDFATTPRRGSRALLQDLGGLRVPGRRSSQHPSVAEGECYELTPRNAEIRSSGSTLHLPGSIAGPQLGRHETRQSLQDVGGLLGNSGNEASEQIQPDSDDTSGISPTSSPVLRIRDPSPTSPLSINAPPTAAQGHLPCRPQARASLQDMGNVVAEEREDDSIH
ncbi:integral membrane protein pth11 [Diplodia corticola]|uniref:Integral membrane protein pth11 n=1 Tax=Diplodia corticola TaxID=236234 RepID=A0A1J9RBF4_9PEZI|nr:integral membrane protein pth11 [Diplodia corticola]OJD29763.1 integral membrane protein pth11 [Diplodia corticola]